MEPPDLPPPHTDLNSPKIFSNHKILFIGVWGNENKILLSLGDVEKIVSGYNIYIISTHYLYIIFVRFLSKDLLIEECHLQFQTSSS